MSYSSYLSDVETSSQVVRTFIQAVRNEQVRKGVDCQDATAYTLGYLESTLVTLIAELPKTRQKAIRSHLAAIAARKSEV